MSPEVVALIIESSAAFAKVLLEAFKNGDHSVLAKPVSEIVPPTLAMTLARRAAEKAAELKFGEPPA